MAFQELLDQVGGLGRFHILQLVLIVPYILMVLSHLLLENFTAAIPAHRCWVNILDNDTVSDNDTGILSPDALLRISIPLDSELRPQKCQRFIHPQWQLLHLNGTFTNMTEPDTEACLNGWVYDQSSFPSTIVSEWDLVCSYQSQRSVAQFLFMAGMLVGGFINGHLSDRFGRKLILRCCLLQLTVFGMSAAFAPSFLIYCSLRFLSGCCSIGVMTNSSILIIEWIRPQSKVLAIILISCALSMGQVLLGGLAFAFREWRTLQTVVSVPFFVFFLSSRFASTIPFYGIILNLQHFGSNIFLFQIVFGALTALVRCLPLLVLNYMGRRTTQTLFMVLTGLLILANTFVPQDLVDADSFSPDFLVLLVFLSPEMQTLRVALASVGIGLAAASFTSFSVYFCEIVPTVFRARMLGFETLASRVGATLAPLLMILQAYASTLPWITYGAFPITAGLAVLFLPETKGLPLLDTIQDLQNIKELSRKVNEINTHIKVTKV